MKGGNEYRVLLTRVVEILDLDAQAVLKENLFLAGFILSQSNSSGICVTNSNNVF